MADFIAINEIENYIDSKYLDLTSLINKNKDDLVKLINSNNEITGMFPAKITDSGSSIITTTEEDGSNYAGGNARLKIWAEFTPDTNIPVHSALVEMMLDDTYTGSGSHSWDLKIIEKGSTQNVINATKSMLSTSDHYKDFVVSIPDRGFTYMLNEIALEAGKTYQVIGYNCSASSVALGYKIADLNQGCNMVIYENSRNEKWPLTNEKQFKSITLASSQNFTVKITKSSTAGWFKINSDSAISSTSHTTTLTKNTPMTITFGGNFTNNYDHLGNCYVELISSKSNFSIS